MEFNKELMCLDERFSNTCLQAVILILQQSFFMSQFRRLHLHLLQLCRSVFFCSLHLCSLTSEFFNVIRAEPHTHTSSVIHIYRMVLSRIRSGVYPTNTWRHLAESRFVAPDLCCVFKGKWSKTIKWRPPVCFITNLKNIYHDVLPLDIKLIKYYMMLMSVNIYICLSVITFCRPPLCH